MVSTTIARNLVTLKSNIVFKEENMYDKGKWPDVAHPIGCWGTFQPVINLSQRLSKHCFVIWANKTLAAFSSNNKTIILRALWYNFSCWKVSQHPIGWASSGHLSYNNKMAFRICDLSAFLFSRWISSSLEDMMIGMNSRYTCCYGDHDVTIAVKREGKYCIVLR